MTGDLLAGMWELIGSLGAVPRRLIWDNEPGSAGRTATPPAWGVRWGPGHQDLHGSSPMTLSPRAWWSGRTGSSRPRSCPGGDFESPADFNTQFAHWLPMANSRLVRADRGPAGRICSMPTRPRCWCCRRFRPRPAGSTRVRLPRDYYVRMRSATTTRSHPQAIGRFVDVIADLQTVTSASKGDASGTIPGPGAPV